jgi:hypothetical protein
VTEVLANIPWTQVGIVGGALVVVYAWLQAFHRTGRATGTVTKIVTRPGPEGDPTDVPLITFTVGGRRYSFLPSLVMPGEAKPKSIGRKVAVAYNPANPEDAEVAVPYRLYLPPIVVTVISVAFLYCAHAWARNS